MSKFNFVYISKKNGSVWSVPQLWGTTRKKSVKKWELIGRNTARIFTDTQEYPQLPEDSEFITLKNNSVFAELPEEFQ